MPQSVGRNHHLLEHSPTGPNGRAAICRWIGLFSGTASAYLSARMGAYPPHRRIQMAKIMTTRPYDTISPPPGADPYLAEGLRVMKSEKSVSVWSVFGRPLDHGTSHPQQLRTSGQVPSQTSEQCCGSTDRIESLLALRNRSSKDRLP